MLWTLSVISTLAALLASTTAFAHQHDNCGERSLVLPGSAGVVFQPTLLSKTPLAEKNGWELQWHKSGRGETQLLAIQRPNMLVRRINPLTGKIISEKQFLSNNFKSNGPTVVHTTNSGELVVAVTRGSDGAVDLYSDAREFRVSAYLSEVIKSIQVVSTPGGDLFLVASTPVGVTVFKRGDKQMEEIAKIKTDGGVRQLFAFEGHDNTIEVAFWGLDHKIHVFSIDGDLANDSLQPQPSFVQLGGRLSAGRVNGRLLFSALENTRSGTSARFFSISERPFSKNLELPQVIGETLFAMNGTQVVIPLKGEDSSVIRKIELTTGKTVGEDIPVGDARLISDLSQFTIGNKTYYVFTKDSSIAYIQNENEVSMIPAPERSSIRQTTPATVLGNGTPVIAVLGFGPAGSVINVISLTGGKKINLPQTAGN